AHHGDALTEEVVEDGFAGALGPGEGDGPAVEVDLPGRHPRASGPAGAFEQFTFVDLEALGERLRIVGVRGDDLHTEFGGRRTGFGDEIVAAPGGGDADDRRDRGREEKTRHAPILSPRV